MTEAIEAKIDGLRDTTEARLAGIEREQHGIVSWLERLSASVEKVADFAGALLTVQTKQAHFDAKLTDVILDIDGLDSRMSDIESDRKLSRWRDGAIIAGLSSAATAAIAFASGKVLGG